MGLDRYPGVSGCDLSAPEVQFSCAPSGDQHVARLRRTVKAVVISGREASSGVKISMPQLIVQHK
jgi:hypothetical protein